MSFNILSDKHCLPITKQIRQTIMNVCIGLVAATGTCMYAQTPTTVQVDGGGTLTYTALTDQEQCQGPHGFMTSYETASFTNVSYSDGSTTTPLGGLLSAVSSPQITGSNCPKSRLAQKTFTISPYVSISFTGDGTGYVSSTATTLSTIDPTYKVVSILYATPGNFSSDSFTNSTTTGTVTTVGSSFAQGVTESFNLGFLGSGVGLSFGTSKTTGSSNSFTETITDGSTSSNASGGAANTINHNQDLIFVWLNPEVSLTQVGSTNVSYSVGTRTLNGGTEPPDVIPVIAASMEDNPSHHTSVSLGLLEPQPNGTPGLAAVCANLNLAEYQSLSCTAADQCGCTPSDFAPILAKDPLLNTNPLLDATTADNPMNVDASGVGNCSSQNPAGDCRYVIVPVSPGSQFQQTTLLQGPTSQGGNRPVNSYTQADSATTTKTLSGSTSESVGYTRKAGFPLIGSISSTTTWTWTDSQSVGAINGTANQIGYSLSSNTVGCAQGILVFEDTVFHTFVTMQAAGNNTCP